MITCRLLGGPADGKILALSAELLTRGIQVAQAPDLTYWSGGEGLSAELVPRTHSYTWDGTINEAGERRMRWTGEPHVAKRLD